MGTATIVKLKTIDGQHLEVSMQAPADIDSFFLFSLHKAGSTLLNQMMKEACGRLGVPVFEPEVVEFENGLKLGTLDPAVQEYLPARGFCFGGFRCWRPYLDGLDLTRYRKLILIRDPRDILVSHYFSHKFSHGIPTGKLGKNMQAFRNSLDSKTIDQYALQRAPVVRNRFLEYKQKVNDNNTRVFRYEDVIFEKARWLGEILDYFNLTMDTNEVEQIASQFDRRPSQEDPGSHIRKVTPGDHKEKLQPETIEKLNRIFAEILSEYKYD